MRLTKVAFIALALAAVTYTAPAATVYTVNNAGGADFTEFSACLTAIAASTDTVFMVNFTDVAPVTYVYPQTTIANGVSLTLSAPAVDVVTLSGWLLAANGGGTFTASKIGFTSPSHWASLHLYDGLTLTDCKFGPGADNGIVIRGGTNTLTNCQFTGIPNSAVIASGGMSNLNNCTWTITAFDNGRCVDVEYIAAGPDTWDTQRCIVNGGSCTTNQFNRPFVVAGFNLEVNNFTCTGGSHPIVRDWESGPGVAVFNNCQFTGCYDRVLYMVQNADKPGTITLNHCTLENRADVTADVAVVESRTGAAGTLALFANGTVFRGLNATNAGTDVVAWGGGKIDLKNCVLDGKSLGVIVNAVDSAAKPCQVDLDHCIVLNTKTDALVASESADNTFSVKNTIIDESNVAFTDVPTTSVVVKTIDHNVVNVVPVPAYATNTFTGDPMFVDRLTGNYRIMAGSSCSGKGIPTSTLLDIDSKAYDLVAPDVGYFELLAVAEVRDWSLF